MLKSSSSLVSKLVLLLVAVSILMSSGSRTPLRDFFHIASSLAVILLKSGTVSNATSNCLITFSSLGLAASEYLSFFPFIYSVIGTLVEPFGTKNSFSPTGAPVGIFPVVRAFRYIEAGIS